MDTETTLNDLPKILCKDIEMNCACLLRKDVDDINTIYLIKNQQNLNQMVKSNGMGSITCMSLITFCMLM